MLADAAAVEQTLFVSQQLYSFCSTLTGFVAVASTAHCLAQLLKSNKLLAQSSTALADTAAPAPALETISFDASAMAVDIVKDAVATPPAAAAMPTPLSDIDDIRAELQRAAEAAVAAIASEAAAPSARRPVAPAAAADPVPTKAGSEQKLTAEDATRQVQEWIAAWGSKSEGAEDADEGSLPPVPASVIAASAAAPVMTDVTPATAAAVLNAMTANVPVGLTAETPVATDAPVAAAEEAVLVLAAAGAQAPVADYQEDAAAAADRAYRERIAAALTDSPAATVGAKARTSVVEVLQSKASLCSRDWKWLPSSAGLPALLSPLKHGGGTRPAPCFLQAVTVGVEYQSKIDALWRESEARRAAEEALLARSERVLAELVRRCGAHGRGRRLLDSVVCNICCCLC